MRQINITLRVVIVFLVGSLAILPLKTKAKGKKKYRSGMYASWGYNTEWYTRPNIKISQPGMGNEYTLNHVTAHDRRGWDHHLLNQPITIPQFNCRLGYIFNEDRGWGVELNYDHPKFIVSEGQQVHITGKRNGEPVDETITFSEANGFFYYLNNGANFFLFNMVKRWKFIADKKGYVRIDAFAKLGTGFMVPHVENSLFGQKNSPHFEVNGWNTGLEAALRLTLMHNFYIEYANKLDYARYRNLKIYEGTARQNMGTYEMILNVGVSIPVRKKTIYQAEDEAPALK